MSHQERVAVTSRSFSKHPILRQELLERYTNVTFNDEGLSLKGEQLIDFLRGHEKAIIALEPITEEVIRAVPELRLISKVGVGLDSIDQKALEQGGVHLSWRGGTNCRSVSELTLGLIICVLRGIPHMHAEVRQGRFKQNKGRCLSEKTVGLIGCGFVGRDLISLLSPFGCRILVYDVDPDLSFLKSHEVENTSLSDLLTNSDIVSLHLPLNDSTHGFLDRTRMEMMKSNAILVNTARGGLVDEEVLIEMIKTNRLAGAALDVFALEPPGDSALLGLDQVVLTPHIGGSTEEAILAMGRAAIEGLDPY